MLRVERVRIDCATSGSEAANRCGCTRRNPVISGAAEGVIARKPSADGPSLQFRATGSYRVRIADQQRESSAAYNVINEVS